MGLVRMVFEQLIQGGVHRAAPTARERSVVLAATLASCLAGFLLGLLSRPRSRRRPHDAGLVDRRPDLALKSSTDLAEANAMLALLRQDILELPSVIFSPRAAAHSNYRG
jgi:hypothetical protein